MEQKRELTDLEKLIESEYNLKKWKILLNLVAQEIGQDKILEIAKSSDYPKTKEEISQMVEQGKLLKDLDRYNIKSIHGLSGDVTKFEELNMSGEYVKWSDIEEIL